MVVEERRELDFFLVEVDDKHGISLVFFWHILSGI